MVTQDFSADFAEKMEMDRQDIEEFKDFLGTLDLSNTEGIEYTKYHISSLYLNCIRLGFSLNKSFDSIFADYLHLLDFYQDVCSPEDSMYDIIDIISLGVLFVEKKDMFADKISAVVKKFKHPDGMITFLTNYINNSDEEIKESAINYFNELIVSDDKKSFLIKESKVWYSKHRGAYWYNSHKSKHKTYCGYWCFEIAALAKIYGIDEHELYENPYYPRVPNN